MKKNLKTSKEWEELVPKRFKLQILDPDGWDRSNYEFSFHEELITWEQFRNRMSYSTCIVHADIHKWDGLIFREELEENGWKEEEGLWRHETFGAEGLMYDEAVPNLPSQNEIPEGWMDWNNQSMDFYVSVLGGWQFQSSGEAKAICKLIAFYEANKDRDPNRTETELYSIKDEWVRHNAKTDRVIAEGTNRINGMFTMEEAQAYVAKQDERVELEKFNQYRLHSFIIEEITSKPLV